MQAGTSRRKAIIENIQWLAGAAIVAVIIWLLAVTAQNPVVEWRLRPSSAIRLEPDAGMIIVNEEVLSRTALVTLRGPSSIQELATPDDVVVYGNLAGLPPGTYTVPLQAEVALNAVVEAVSPAQLTVVLEVQAAQFVPVRETIVQPPPADVQIGSISFDVLQAEVSGPQSRVQQVVAAVAPLDLTNQRASFQTDVRLIPVDVDGDEVEDVTVTPPSAHATVTISQRDNVREFNVRPQLEGSLPEGYFIASLTYSPTTVYLSGPSETLQTLPSTVFTSPIDLSNQRANFEVVVPIELTSDAVVPVSQSNITVSVGVAAQTGNEQLDDVPVELVGRRDGLVYTVDPEQVTLVITGPQPVVGALTASDVQVTADVSAYTTAGSYRTSLTITLPSDATGATVTALPADVTVVVAAAAEATAEP